MEEHVVKGNSLNLIPNSILLSTESFLRQTKEVKVFGVVNFIKFIGENSANSLKIREN